MTGATANLEQPDFSQGSLFGSFLSSLHLPAPANAPISLVRGVPLIQRSPAIEQRMARLEKTNLVTQKIKHIWQRALDAPIDVLAKWLHGDLHPGNILVEKGAVVGIIDWGDLTSEDIATDLAAIWMLFGDRNARHAAISEYADISVST